MDLIRVFIFFFVHLVGICPVEGVNCPPARAKPKIIRRNAIPRRDFSFIWLSPGSSCLRSREAPVQRRSSYRLLLQPGRRCVGTSQDVVDTLGIKSRFNVSSTNFSKFEHGVLISPWHQVCTGSEGRLVRLYGILQTASSCSRRIRQAGLSCCRSPPRDKLQRFRHYLAAFLATILSRSFLQSEL